MQRALFTLIATAIITLAGPLRASETTIGSLKIEHPWARATAGAAANGAAYMVISTSGNEADQLIGATSPVAATVELHTHVMEGDVMRMRPVKAIEVNAGEPAVLKPGGLHVMLIGLRAPLKQGASFPLTLTFAKSGTVTVNVDVEGPGAGHDVSKHRH
ncbi:MAG: copper chaperone PCu(A)C [Rhodospirillales bacterium]|jgi:hypothetical protein|nr:copper chaperone PCu(A)C [Rhodospirillales bacterium]